MKILKLFLLLTIVALSFAAPFWFQHRADLALAAAENTEHANAAEIARLSSANQTPSQAQTSAPAALSQDELTELLHLRNEVSRLHTAVAETTKLRASAATGAPAAPPPAGPNYWPQNQLAFSGYSTPDSTLKTALWAMKNADINAVIACMSPENVAAIQKEMQKDAKTQEEMENQFKGMASAMTAGTTGYRLLDRTNDAPDETTMRLGFDGQGVDMEFKLKKVGADWKLQDAGQPRLPDQSR